MSNQKIPLQLKAFTPRHQLFQTDSKTWPCARPRKGEGANLLFCQIFSLKLHDNEKKLDPGASLAPLPGDPPMDGGSMGIRARFSEPKCFYLVGFFPKIIWGHQPPPGVGAPPTTSPDPSSEKKIRKDAIAIAISIVLVALVSNFHLFLISDLLI